MRRVDLAILLVLVPTLAACNRQPPAGANVPANAAPPVAASPMPPTTAPAPNATAGVPAASAATSATEGAAPASNQAASNAGPLDAKAVLRQLADFYRAKKTFQVDYEQKISMDLNGMKNAAESQAKIAVERPNRIAIRQKDSQLGVDVVCDGELLSISFPPVNQYTQSAAPKLVDELLTNALVMGGGLARGPLLDLFSNDPFETLMQGVTKAEYAGREKIGNVDAHHLKFQQDQMDWELWVAAENQPIVVQAAFDMAKSLAATGLPAEQLKGAKMGSVQLYKNWQFDAPSDGKTFAFEPPAGATKVDSFFAGGAGGAEPETSPLVGKPAPDVEQELLEGGHFSLKEQKDKKVVILDFWATWCGPCVAEMPLVAKVAEDYRDKGVALYCLNQGEEAGTIREFLDKEKLGVTVGLDPKGEAGAAYGVTGIPMLVLIDKAGVVQSVHVGFSPDIGEKLKVELDAILAGKDLAAEAEAGREGKVTAEPTEGVE